MKSTIFFPKSDRGSPLLLYPDSNFFRRLTRGSDEHPYVEFIEECEIYGIALQKGCTPIFTPFVFLESIGLGGILKPLIKNETYKSLVKSIQYQIKEMPDPSCLNESDLIKCQQGIADSLDEMGKTFLSLLHQHKDLEVNLLIELMNDNLVKYTTSVIADRFIQLTLKRFHASFKTNPSISLSILNGSLAWNLIACFPFIEPDQISKENALSMFQKAEMWFNALFAAFHKAVIKGITVGFFRLAENRAYSFSKIIAKDPNNPQFIVARDWLGRYKRLRREDDLCDGELIDFAVLGLDGQKVSCFTSDNYLDLRDRLDLFKQTLDDVSRDVEGWSIKPCLGSVYCTSPTGNPLRIMQRFLLDQVWDANDGAKSAQ